MPTFKLIIQVLLITQAYFIQFNLAHAELENRFTNSDFDLQWSSEYQTKNIKDPRVVVFIKHRQQDFPTINIIKIPGLYNFNRDTTKQLEELNTSYQLAGIQVKTSNALDNKIGSKNFHAQVVYLSNQKEFLADVVIFNGATEHYIFTMITPSTYMGREEQVQQILKNLIVKHEATVNTEDSRNGLFYWIIIAIVVLLVVFLIPFKKFKKL